MKYQWVQRYAIDRIDFDDPQGHLIGWITQNRIDNISERDVSYVTRGCLGYVSAYHRVSANGAKYVWNIWWAQRDKEGYILPETGTDNLQYSTMQEAKEAMQKIFNVADDNVKSIDNYWNTTQYV